ncbi:MAG: SusD/RagB family nutrient-binding outer membrane lipoprotein [Bacteroidales bacterium]|nr:SusD/RagB family nutrient-binding outer membrane lipoprotein [Bacteroidales bacterium]
MNLRKLLYPVVAAVVISTTSCKDWLDINHNPNNPESVALAEALLPGIEVSTGYNQMAWDFLFTGGVWNQYFTQNENASQFKTAERYYAQDFNYYWNNAYSTQLSELKYFASVVEDNSKYKFLSEVLAVYIWGNLVDLYGDIPYKEALDLNNLAPRFDKAEDIYKDLLSRIDAAISNYENGVYTQIPTLPDYEKYDFIFAGDFDKWYQFANSLKLKLNIRLSEVPELGMSMAQLKSFIADESKFLTKENAQLSSSIWGDKSTKEYPLVEYNNSTVGSNTNIVASLTYTSYTALGSDPRAVKIFGNNPKGELQGDFGAHEQSSPSTIVTSSIVKNIPLISNWEVYFNFAEIYTESGDLASAKTAYEKAVKSSLDYWGISDYGILSNANYASWDDLATDKEKALRLIGLQRWVAFAMTQHTEAFFTRNRTKYPALSSIVSSDATREKLSTDFPAGCFILSFAGANTYAGAMPASAVYPQDIVLARNTNAPAQKSNVTVKVFWDKKQIIKE